MSDTEGTQIADLVDAMRLVEAADEMFWEIRAALTGHDWFDSWASINEAAALATRTILETGPRLICYERRENGVMSDTPTPEEVAKVRRYECSIHGHSFDVIVTLGSLDPQHIICTTCDETWAVGARIDGTLRSNETGGSVEA